MDAGGRETVLGLRVDVDTHEGMRDGVPRLLETLEATGARATFYFSMGPDRSGLAVLNALRPGFLGKMRRTGAARVYGWRTMLSGTLLPARPIATAFPATALRAREAGHETGVHAWDHRLWQDRLFRLEPVAVTQELDRGYRAYVEIFGDRPRTFAAPAWLSRDEAVLHQEGYGLDFGSDCRGAEPFVPVVRGRRLSTPQVPATLPTLDEALGDTCRDARSYFDAVLGAIRPATWHVLTVHAEFEGGVAAADFLRFLKQAPDRGIRCAPLGELLAARRASGDLPECVMEHHPVRGRHGVVSVQLPEPGRRQGLGIAAVLPPRE